MGPFIQKSLCLAKLQPGFWRRFASGIMTPNSSSIRMEGREAVAASEVLWNAVETGEKRRDARYGTELVLALPIELTREENIELVRAFIEQNYTAKGRVADWPFTCPKGANTIPMFISFRPFDPSGTWLRAESDHRL